MDINNYVTALKETRLLVNRLEKLSADSLWAHRASGVRGALLRTIEALEAELGQPEKTGEIAEKFLQLEDYKLWGYRLLENAAKEISAYRNEQDDTNP